MTFRLFPFFVTAIFVLVLFPATGCNKHPVPPGLPKLYPCTITITQENQPLARVTVSLILKDGSRPWVIGGSTDDKGIVKVNTQIHFHGAPAGEYKVCLFKTIQEGEPITIPPSNPDAVAVQIIPSYYVVDPKYDRYDSTPFEITVSTDGKNKTSFDVGKPFKKRVPD
jgi:hypothetical protein